MNKKTPNILKGGAETTKQLNGLVMPENYEKIRFVNINKA